MRITNKMIQENALFNLNQNKIRQDQLNTQMTTQSKITRPSDDPVVAIRALRLRNNLSEINQFYEKNVPDAQSWLKLTNDAIESVGDVVAELGKLFGRGSADQLSPTDRAKILEDVKALRDQIYATGNADFAGRTIFTGYRTNAKVTYTEDTREAFSITEQVKKDIIDEFTYVNTGNLTDLNEGNYLGGSDENDIGSSQINRIRLSYNNLTNGQTPSLNVQTGVDADGKKIYSPLQVGTPPGNVDIVTIGKGATPNPYDSILLPANADKVIFVPETGEMLLGSNVKAAMENLPKDQEVAVTYEKESWKKDDLRPEQYFACTKNPGAADALDYNPEYLLDNPTDSQKQHISYDISAYQSLRVNTLASEVFTHNIGRDVDEMVAAVEEVIAMEEIIAKLEGMQKNPALNQDEITKRLAAANKAKVELSDRMTKSFGSGNTKMKGYADQTSVALTNVANRQTRLDLVDNRLMSQQTNFQELKEQNEGVDVITLGIQFKSAQMAYEGALSATAKIIQNSLLNFL